MYAVSREFLDAIRGSHTVEVKAVAYLSGSIVTGAEDLHVVEGSIRADAQAKVRRQLEGLRVISTDGQSSTLRDLLSPSGTELQIYRGIRFPNGRVELAPVGRFRIDSVVDDLAQPGAVTINGPDVGARVVDDRFLTPESPTAGTAITDLIESLIQDSIPGAIVHDNSGSSETVPGGIVWERERWDAIEELAAAIGCAVYADPVGEFQISPVRSLDSPADWLINAGARAVLLGGERSTTREGVYNVVVASSSPTDGSTPVTGIAQDTNPGSPTYVLGPYGRVPRFYSSPLLKTDAQAESAAETILSRSLGFQTGLSLVSMVNPALDVGDRIDAVLSDGTLQRHIIDGQTVPLSPTDSMPIATRAATVEEES